MIVYISNKKILIKILSIIFALSSAFTLSQAQENIIKEPNIKTDYYQSFVRQEKDYINFNFNIFNNGDTQENYGLVLVINKDDNGKLIFLDQVLATTTILKIGTTTINYNYYPKIILSEGEYFASLKIVNSTGTVLMNFIPVRDFVIRDLTKPEKSLSTDDLLSKHIKVDYNIKNILIVLFALLTLSSFLYFTYRGKNNTLKSHKHNKMLSLLFIFTSLIYFTQKINAQNDLGAITGSGVSTISNTLTMGQGQTVTLSSPNCPSEVSAVIDYGPNLYFSATNCYSSETRETFIIDQGDSRLLGSPSYIGNPSTLSLSELFKLSSQPACQFLCFSFPSPGEFTTANKDIYSSPVGFGGENYGWFFINHRGNFSNTIYIHKFTIVNTFKTCTIGGPIVPATQVCPATNKSCPDGSIIPVSDTCPVPIPVHITCPNGIKILNTEICPPVVNIYFR